MTSICSFIIPHYFYFLTGILHSSPGTAQQNPENCNVAMSQKGVCTPTHIHNHTEQVLLLPLFSHTSFLKEDLIWGGDVCDG